MAGTSLAIVAGLTAAALATVGYLGHRAAETVPPDLKRQASGSPAPAPKAPRSKHPAALPPRTGVGQRVVYSLGRERVWLVDQGDTVRRTFGVSPSTVDPAPGTYRVTSRSGRSPARTAYRWNTWCASRAWTAR